MKTKFLRLSLLFIFFATTFTLSSYAQTPEQINEVKRMEEKVNANKNNPNFDYSAAVIRLNALKKAYGIAIEEISNNSTSAKSAISTAEPSSTSATSTDKREESKASTEGSVVIEITQEDFNNISPEKQAIIKNSPEKYKVVQRAQRSSSTVITISKEEFEKMPQEKKQHILNNPDKYKISQ